MWFCVSLKANLNVVINFEIQTRQSCFEVQTWIYKQHLVRRTRADRWVSHLKFTSQTVAGAVSGCLTAGRYCGLRTWCERRPRTTRKLGLLAIAASLAFVSKLQQEVINLNLHGFLFLSTTTVVWNELGLIGAIKRWSKLFVLRVSQTVSVLRARKAIRPEKHSYLLMCLCNCHGGRGVDGAMRVESPHTKWDT